MEVVMRRYACVHVQWQGFYCALVEVSYDASAHGRRLDVGYPVVIPIIHLPSLMLNGLFFFQAEDGIRDDLVTGVQTCALPIWRQLISSPKPSISPTPKKISFWAQKSARDYSSPASGMWQCRSCPHTLRIN